MVPPVPPRPPRYRLYVDESGDHSYSRLDEAPHRYLALLGVWFRQPDDYAQFTDGLARLKRDIWGPRPDRPIVLHRSDIINQKRAFGVLREPDLRRRFDSALLELVGAAQFRMAAVILDKRNHLARYTTPFHPYHFATAALLERYGGWLDRFHSVGDVMAESRGREEDLQLKQAYRNLYTAGTHFVPHARFQRVLTSRDIKFSNKQADIAGLQLADVLAHPVRAHCLAERGLASRPAAGFGSEMVAAVLPKFNCHAFHGRIDGYGRVYLSCDGAPKELEGEAAPPRQ